MPIPPLTAIIIAVENLPAALFLSVLLAAVGLRLWGWRRRVNAFWALAEQFHLRDARSDLAAPDPAIRGLVLHASYPRFLIGALHGVDVVAFDYRIGWGRGQRRGAGVGVRAALDPRTLRARLGQKLVVSQQDGWTFVYTDPVPFMRFGYGMNPADMEDLWRKLLRSAAADRAEWPGASPVGPGEVLIRPLHLHMPSR